MSPVPLDRDDRPAGPLRALADQAFSRAAGAPLVPGNAVRLLRDAAENYPAWLAAIDGARSRVLFENYIFHDDGTGRRFAGALAAAARRGVRVRLTYDWLGCLGPASRSLWAGLREAGVEVRAYNPFRFTAPLAWLSRDHRKSLVADGEVAFVSGLCVGNAWAGDPTRGLEPWRDTGIELRGPAVADVERAFAGVWAMMGPPIPEAELAAPEGAPAPGEVSLRIVASEPATAGMLRVDQLVAALARERVWLTDPYYAATPVFAEALRAAARGGVDVRLLVPGGSDLGLLQQVSRAGYRSLLEAGVRVFEWKGSMIHAKTAVADGRWARVGSTNLNVSSWFGNCELDAVIEDGPFACRLEEMFQADLENAVELTLDARHKICAPRPDRPRRRRRVGSAGRAAAGVVRVGNTVGEAFRARRRLEPVEGRAALLGGLGLLALAVAFACFPRLLAIPVAAALAWGGLALLYRATGRARERARARRAPDRKRRPG